MRRKIKRVVDGDTVELYRKVGESRFIRLSGVNAPEKHQFGGAKATSRLRSLVGGRTVTIRPESRGHYGRTIATIISDRKNVNKRLRKKRR